MKNATLIIASIALVLLGASFLTAVVTGYVTLALQLATITLLGLVAFVQIASMQRSAK